MHRPSCSLIRTVTYVLCLRITWLVSRHERSAPEGRKLVQANPGKEQAGPQQALLMRPSSACTVTNFVLSTLCNRNATSLGSTRKA